MTRRKNFKKKKRKKLIGREDREKNAKTIFYNFFIRFYYSASNERTNASYTHCAHNYARKNSFVSSFTSFPRIVQSNQPPFSHFVEHRSTEGTSCIGHVIESRVDYVETRPRGIHVDG